MSGQKEQETVKAFVNIIASQPVTFHDDFQELPEKTLKKVPVLHQVRVPLGSIVPTTPNEHHPHATYVHPARSSPASRAQKGGIIRYVRVSNHNDISPLSANPRLAPTALQITFKSLKPPFSITIPVSPADAISALKTQIAAQPHAPPAAAQRLLLKGKALADAKLLKEYNVQDGDTINLMVKPGVEWDPTAETKEDQPSSLLLSGVPLPKTASLSPGAPPDKERKRGHTRIPSVVLSPTPSSPLEKPQDIQLVDGDGCTISADISNESSSAPPSTYQTAVSQPEYWQKLLAFLRFVKPCCCMSSELTSVCSRSEFPSRGDAENAFEDYLAASKGVLTASEIAKIRDSVGITGMAGT